LGEDRQTNEGNPAFSFGWHGLGFRVASHWRTIWSNFADQDSCAQKVRQGDQTNHRDEKNQPKKSACEQAQKYKRASKEVVEPPYLSRCERSLDATWKNPRARQGASPSALLIADF
jgi:hypothetical protein